MAYGNKYKGKGKKEYTSVQCTGLFKSSGKKGLYVGSTSGEYFDKFVEKVKEAKKKEKGVVFFLWRNDPDKSEAAFTLYMDVDSGQKKGRKIEEDDDFESKEDPEEDVEPEGDPFDD